MAKSVIAAPPFRLRLIPIGIAGHPSCSHAEHQQQSQPESGIEQHSQRRELDAPDQHSHRRRRHALPNQPSRYPPFSAHISTPSAAEPAAKAFCIADASSCAHSHHLLRALKNYSSLLQFCRLAVTNASQSSGGFPRPSIFSNTAYGSDLLPEERSVFSSLTQT